MTTPRISTVLMLRSDQRVCRCVECARLRMRYPSFRRRVYETVKAVATCGRVGVRLPSNGQYSYLKTFRHETERP